MKGRSPTALRTIVRAGSFDTLMPPFYGRLEEDDFRGLIRHLQSTSKLDNPAWTIDDIKASIKVYVKDESTLPAKPAYEIDSIVTAIDLNERKIIKKLEAGCIAYVGGGAAVEVDGRTLGYGANFGDCDKMVVSAWDLDKMEVVKHRGREEPLDFPFSPNRACSSPAHGSPVDCFLIGTGSLPHGLQPL